ncbi:hypothetical protein Tdes44962_MAKER06458 [Teratosphaeria destructans]|uniref:Mmc1 C-terminal domain-containing protein n=1 Tax=Teratosphaeria destructans TaxID=418781 RepID=A0A9W7T1Q0_9PEZI|nr:hypothetical protein Tdes44962_MAKER06458 [Teratosphaeria destructans]
MPGRVLKASAGLQLAAVNPYVCPSCLFGRTAWNLSRTGHADGTRHLSAQPLASRSEKTVFLRQKGGQWLHKTFRPHGRRSAANVSLASATAINAPSTVPEEYRALHQRLSLLQEEATSYVDLARLKLACRSLESRKPAIRVALLGLGVNGALAARKLARVLLSDALGDEEAWEREVIDTAKDGRSLLLRYGSSEDVVEHGPIVQTVHIPSPFLRRHSLEILVTTLNADGRAVDQVSETEIEAAILVPPLTTPTSAGGRVGFVRYPVHKALVVAEGMTGAVDYGRLPRFLEKSALIHSALSLPLPSSHSQQTGEQTRTFNVVDIDLATHALDLFRTSKANGAQFSKEWQMSRMPSLTEWLGGARQSEYSGMHPDVRTLLDSVLVNASSAVEQSESAVTSAALLASIPESKRRGLDKTISDWSADAHRDLQLNLNTALSSYTWRRTAWWRLFWRIDDVSVSAGDVLRLAWLTEAEQNLAFLSGRIVEAGIAGAAELKAAGSVTETQRELPPSSSSPPTSGEVVETQAQTWEPKRAQVMTPADLLSTPTLVSQIEQQGNAMMLFDPPWPQTIYLSRQQILNTLVPALHRRAQVLLLSTLSTIGGTSALGAWILVAFTDMYAAGAVASLGLVWSLRRLQKLWGRERDGFTDVIREDGRKVLGELENVLRSIVQDGGKVEVRSEDKQSWTSARKAIASVRDELAKIE